MMSFEHRSKPLLPRHKFFMRVGWYALMSLLLIIVSLIIGVLGYHYLNGLGWLDALVNASMILTGMGPVDPLKNNAAKWFASAYAIFSGVAFLSIIAVLLAPAVHRFLHKLHIEEKE
jgi:hypothetical protein